MKLGPRQKQWIKDLPKYKKAHGVLYHVASDSFCCLGVYAHTQIESPWKQFEHIPEAYYITSKRTKCSTYLAPEDYKNLGLFSAVGDFKADGKLTILSYKEHIFESLADLNDKSNITLKEMAKFIEENAEFIFREPK